MNKLGNRSIELSSHVIELLYAKEEKFEYA